MQYKVMYNKLTTLYNVRQIANATSEVCMFKINVIWFLLRVSLNYSIV